MQRARPEEQVIGKSLDGFVDIALTYANVRVCVTKGHIEYLLLNIPVKQRR